MRQGCGRGGQGRQPWRLRAARAAALAACAAAAAMWALGAPRTAHAADPLEVVKLVLAEREIGAGGQQILQVTLRGLAAKPVRAGLRVELRDGKDIRIGRAIERVVQVAGPDERQEFFRFEAPNRFGRFTVRVEVFTPDFKSRLLAGAPVFYAPFQVGTMPEPGLAAAPSGGEAEEPGKKAGKAGPPSFPAPRGLMFEKPDLVWENLDIQPSALLVGEPLKIKVDLRNVGGDIARGIDVKVDAFNTRTPANLLPISLSTVQALAPGDKVEMEFETKFPEDAPLGEYKVRLVIDPANRIAESNKENNVLESEVPIRLSLIRQVFPEPGYYFEQAGLFLFRWDSRRFDEFKVQVGTDETFTKTGAFYDIPQGDKWTKDQEIVPLEGELPDMAVGLMQKERTDRLYWRVVGRSASLGVEGVSAASPFSIRRMAAKPAQAGGEEPVSGGAQQGPTKERVPPPQAVEAPAKASEENRPTETTPGR